MLALGQSTIGGPCHAVQPLGGANGAIGDSIAATSLCAVMMNNGYNLEQLRFVLKALVDAH